MRGSIKFVPIMGNSFVGVKFYLVWFDRIVQTAEVKNFIDGIFEPTTKQHLDVYKSEHYYESLKYPVVVLGSVKTIPPLGWGGSCRFLVIKKEQVRVC